MRATAICLLQQGQSEQEGGKRERERKGGEWRVLKPEAVVVRCMRGETESKGKTEKMREVNWLTGVQVCI